MNSVTYCLFLEDNFLPWLEDQPLLRRTNLLFRQDNAPAHASKYSKRFLQSHGLHGRTIMDWPMNSPDLSLTENFWAIIKRRIYANVQQYNSYGALWSEIKRACSSVTPDEVRKVIKFVDKRLINV